MSTHSRKYEAGDKYWTAGVKDLAKQNSNWFARAFGTPQASQCCKSRFDYNRRRGNGYQGHCECCDCRSYGVFGRPCYQGSPHAAQCFGVRDLGREEEHSWVRESRHSKARRHGESSKSRFFGVKSWRETRSKDLDKVLAKVRNIVEFLANETVVLHTVLADQGWAIPASSASITLSATPG
jgi:hypothetical protein